MGPIRRAVASVSRRLERPELLAALYPGASAGAARGDRDRRGAGERAAPRTACTSTSAPIAGRSCARPCGSLPARGTSPSSRSPAWPPSWRGCFPAWTAGRWRSARRPGWREFCHFRSLEGWSGLRRSPEISDEQGDPEYIEVNVSTLDAEVRDLSPTVLKIDVEGAELGVLEGGRAVLSEARPLVIFEHVAAAAGLYGARPEAIWELLAELGYEIFAVTGEGPLGRRGVRRRARRGQLAGAAGLGFDGEGEGCAHRRLMSRRPRGREHGARTRRVWRRRGRSRRRDRPLRSLRSPASARRCRTGSALRAGPPVRRRRGRAFR